jgi:RNase P subunit RPR2
MKEEKTKMLEKIKKKVEIIDKLFELNRKQLKEKVEMQNKIDKLWKIARKKLMEMPNDI